MKRKARCIRWLYGELPELVRSGIIPEEAARRLQEHYGDPGKGLVRPATIAAIVCGVLGALLVGGGIILILAHNWEDLPRSARTALAFAPLAAAQALGFWVLARRNTSTAWREGAATFLALSVGAALSLVYQIYHIPDQSTGILLKWALLILPVVYVFRSVTVVLLYFLLIVVWTANWRAAPEAAAFWLLLGAVLPEIVAEFRQRADSAAAELLAWGLALCLTAGLPFTLHEIIRLDWMLAYSALFSGMYLAARLYSSGDRRKRFARPFSAVGASGTLILAYFMSFRNAWKSLGWSDLEKIGAATAWEVLDFVVVGILFGAALLFLVRAIRSKSFSCVVPGAAPVLTVAGYSFALLGGYQPAALLFNAYLLVVGTLWIAQGVRQGRIGRVNAGMAVVSILAFIRFLDSGFGFIERGIAFIVVGAAFLTLNLVLFRRRRSDMDRPASQTTGHVPAAPPEDEST